MVLRGAWCTWSASYCSCRKGSIGEPISGRAIYVSCCRDRRWPWWACRQLLIGAWWWILRGAFGCGCRRRGLWSRWRGWGWTGLASRRLRKWRSSRLFCEVSLRLAPTQWVFVSSCTMGQDVYIWHPRWIAINLESAIKGSQEGICIFWVEIYHSLSWWSKSHIKVTRFQAENSYLH